jgi:hypothetical protein
VDELKLMTQLADYYCALPALSKSIDLPLSEGDINVNNDANFVDLIWIASPREIIS